MPSTAAQRWKRRWKRGEEIWWSDIHANPWGCEEDKKHLLSSISHCNGPTTLNKKHPQLLIILLNVAQEFTCTKGLHFGLGLQHVNNTSLCCCLQAVRAQNSVTPGSAWQLPHIQNSNVWSVNSYCKPPPSISAPWGVYPTPIWQLTAFPAKPGPSATLHTTKLTA